MFTGIIEELGTVVRKERRGALQRIVIEASFVLEEMRVGDSINIDGACHTVVEANRKSFAVESVEETLRRTTLGDLRAGEQVNLERSMRLSDRLGGHLVSGHVDGVGVILGRTEQPGNVIFTIGFPKDLVRYVAPKGSIAVDGISLTIVSASEESFTVSIIPYTLEMTTLRWRRPGDMVNLEVDLLTKYVERLLKLRDSPASKISEAWLREMGF